MPELEDGFAAEYEALYNALLDDVRELRKDFRAMQLLASDREAFAYADAFKMTNELFHRALRREDHDD